MVRPERRTRADLLAALAIAVVVAVAAGVIWWTSDARATVSKPAAEATKSAVAADAVPATLKELWTAPSPYTTTPVVAGGRVVTGDGTTVTGRDPVSGAPQWTFARDRELCGVSWVYYYAVAVYPDGRGCGQVSTIDSSTGLRGPTRSGFADKHVELSSDGTTVLAAGSTRLELWRSDMVRVMGYGEVDARVLPAQTGVGKGCTLLNAAASTSAVSVLQACDGQPDVRLTLLLPADQDDQPKLKDVVEKGVTAQSGARVLAVSDTTTAVYLPLPSPRVSVVDETGSELASTPVPEPPSSAEGRNGPGADVSRAGDLFTWWTGTAVMVFDANHLEYRYTIPAAGPVVPLGPAAMMAKKLLIPVTGGIGVYDQATGVSERVIPVTRPPADTAIVPAVSGPTVLEQRGHSVVALGQ
ncbi:hypothetical protein BH09ACT7_BH09ACT7_25640 [soil metagenome]